MELELLEKKENPLLKRTEIRFEALHQKEATPSREDIRENIAKSLKAPKEKVILDSMQSEFGRGKTTGYAKVYETIEAAKKYERKHILVRNQLIKPEIEKKKPKPEKKVEKAPEKKAEEAPEKDKEKQQKEASKKEKKPEKEAEEASKQDEEKKE